MRESLKYIKTKALRRARRVRAKLYGTAARPRLTLHISGKHISAQCIDDEAQQTIFAASDALLDKKTEHLTAEHAYELGKKFGESAKSAGITIVIFDRGAHAYHGRVKAFAAGAREGGLKF